MVQKRDNTVSIVKAIAIILMVLLHSSRMIESNFFGQFVCTFHMPIFFIMAGYCFKEKYLENPKAFISKRINGLYTPFIKYGFIFLLLHNLFYRLHIYDNVYGHYDGTVSSLYGTKDFLLQAQRILRMVGNEQLLAGYWFLKSLFYGSLMSYAMLKYLPIESLDRKVRLGGGIFLFLTVIMVIFDITIPVIGLTGKEFIGATYFLLGYSLKKSHILDSDKKLSTYIVCVLGITFALFVSFIQPCSIPTMTIEKLPLYVLTSISISVVIIKIVRYIEPILNDNIKKIVVSIGDNTLPILTWHFLSFKLVSLFIILVYGLPIQELACFPVIQDYSSRGFWIGYLIVGITIPLIINKLITHNKSKI